MIQRVLGAARHAGRLASRRPRGWRSVLYNTAMSRLGVPAPLLMPAHISIEPTNACNARCPICETGNRSMERPWGMLDEAAFRQFIDQNAATTAVLMYYFMGEPFMNPKAYEMIRYARDKNIYVETCTNGDFVDAEGIIYSDINQVSFQIGGLTNDVHQIYRVRSDLDKAIRNIEALVEARRRTPGSNVQIEIGFIVMRHNEHQVGEFVRWAKGIGADKANVIDPCVRSVMEGHAYLPEDRRYWFYDEEAFEQGYLKPKKTLDNECTWVWNSVMVNWDGSVVPCCRDPHGRHVFGNAFERPLREIWNDKPVVDFRHKIATAQRDIDICALCSGFGVPQLHRARPIDFEARRLSFDKRPLDLPDDVKADLEGGRLQAAE